jgi:hypothetical protein
MKTTAFLLLVGALVSTPVFSQDTDHRDPCKAMPADGSVEAKYFLPFDAFDRELRAALTKEDALALAFLVKFPLRVNAPGGAYSLDDAQALQTHFQEVFSTSVRKAILDQPIDEIGCNIEGVMYGQGVIWVNATKRGYEIEVVNDEETLPALPKGSPQTKYICQTQTHRVVVDALADGALRYRAWNKPRAISEKPDLEILGGKDSFEGSDICAYPVWTFKNGQTAYRAEGALGCYGEVEPPKDATGRLVVTVPGKPDEEAWCF